MPVPPVAQSIKARGGAFSPLSFTEWKVPLTWHDFRVQTAPSSGVWEDFQVQTTPVSGVYEDFRVRV